MTGDIGPHGGLLAPLWGVVESVTAGSEAVATALRAAGASVVHVHDPYDGAGIAPQAFPPGAVPPLEHGELLLRVRARRLCGRPGPQGAGATGPGRALLPLPARGLGTTGPPTGAGHLASCYGL